ncbi:glycosyltransferase [Dokdonella sp.]|uniref:glycosyltransferase n=1 Tax=Dokdonella sp. TaxID=2291710 RepID=UPI002F42BEF5
MRILHLGKYYAPQRGGIERHTQALAEACVRAGDAVAVLVHQAPGRWRGMRETMAGVDVRRAGCIAAPVYTPVSPTFPIELARALREFAPDLLHLHLPNPSCFAALALPAARRLPWVVHWHADVPPDAPDWRLRAGYRFYRPFEQAVLARATTVIATSQPYFEASRALQRWSSKVRIVPLGIEPAATVVPRRDMWPASGGMHLLAVGRLGRYKGFDVLIEALPSMPDASLLLVGDGECAGELRALARSRGVEARVAFAGDVDDASLGAAYAGADALVLPSLDRGEAFGLVLLEAMRVGVPVVASAIPGSGVGFVVAGGESGLLVEPGDPAALAAALARLRDPLLRARLGDAGRTRWNERFTLERCVQTVRAIYADASASGGTRSVA